MIEKIKFYIGPMTQNVIDAAIEYVEENDIHLGFCTSRRQIDYDGGYVGYNTQDFIKYVKSKTKKILICRDHGSIAQGKTYDDGLDSLYYDASCGIDLIHIDPWKKYYSYKEGLEKTINDIKFVYELNKNVLFEIGTEEVLRKFETKEFYKLIKDLKHKLREIFDTNIRYAVIQSGTKLIATKNMGEFNLKRLKEMIQICEEFGILSKEHNGDYLSDEEIKIRFDMKLDAINIAPEFGVFETNILLNHINNINLEKIYKICLDGKKWEKWIPKDFNVKQNKLELIKISGHYHNKEIKEIIGMDDNDIIIQLKNKINNFSNI